MRTKTKGLSAKEAVKHLERQAQIDRIKMMLSDDVEEKLCLKQSQRKKQRISDNIKNISSKQPERGIEYGAPCGHIWAR